MDLVERARTEGTPLIDGDRATFVWEGEGAPVLLASFAGWDPSRGVRLEPAGPGVWSHMATLPSDAYVEYAYVRGSERVRDPFNDALVRGGVGPPNHFFRMPESRPSPYTAWRRGTPHGELTRHEIDRGQGRRRAVHVYRPPATGPFPLLVVLDGQDYLRRVRLPTIVDNLVAARRMRPVALAMIENARRGRTAEYASNDFMLLPLLDTVLPFAREVLALDERPGAHGVIGSSLGGLFALYAGLRAPDIFGHVLAQSGTYAMAGRDFVVHDLVRHGPVRQLKVWLDCGTMERLIEGNRRMCALLRERGYVMEYREFNGGHNWTSWRDDVWRGLEWLFPPAGEGGA
ncbi:MAG: alpha/beta hydrolase-fold protein [Candidatus Limnocylindria bacterium]